MGKFTTLIQTIREDGARLALLKIWQYMIAWGPFPRILRSFLSSAHKEKVWSFAHLGYWPEVRNPRSFNEKVQHRKLYTDKELFSQVQDKYLVRSYVAERIGEDILTDLYHVTDDPSTIPFDDLPNRFVVKATHGWGWNIIVPEKNDVDFKQIQSQCNDWLDQEFGHFSDEYWYWDITPRIIVEEYIQDEARDIPLDFKFFVFNGDVEVIQVDVDRFSGHSRRLYTPRWETTDVKYGYPLADDVDRPPQLSEMVSIAEILGEEFDFVRVDLYNPVDGRIVFGELTIAPTAGWKGFEPVDFDFELGSYWPDS